MENTWHYRLDRALAVRGKEWSDLFDYLSPITHIRRPSVYAWKPGAEKRSTMINGDNAALVCKWLKINPIWLFYDQGKSGLDPEEQDELDRISEIYEKLSPTRKSAAEQMLMGFLALEIAEKKATQIERKKAEREG